MSTIKFAEKAEGTVKAVASLVDYSEILQRKITSICNSIGFNDSKITWVIYDPPKPNLSNLTNKIRIGHNGLDYGFTLLTKNEIWISTSSIMKDVDLPLASKIFKKPEDGNDFLARVILDEITHVQTDCDHGMDKYDRKLEENCRKYFGGHICGKVEN